MKHLDLAYVLILGALATGSLSSCTTVRPIIGPDGTEHELVACSAIESCYDKAREVCRGPYKIVNTSSETVGANGSTGTTVKLLVKCGPFEGDLLRK